MPDKLKYARNKRIVELFESGQSLMKIGKQYGLSFGRVSRIIKEWRARERKANA